MSLTATNKIITEKYDIIETIEGHYSSHSNEKKNPVWRVKEKENGKEVLLMYCEKDTIVKLCDKSYQMIKEYEKDENDCKKITWYQHQNGYVLCHKNFYTQSQQEY